MKQLIPFVMIGIIVVGAIFILQDDYQDPFLSDYSVEDVNDDWTATFFINDIESDDAEVGLRLEYMQATFGNIEAVEFFVETEDGGFFFQDLELENFNGTIIHSETCDFCERFSEEELNVNASVNWRVENETKSATYYFSLANLAED